MSSESGEQTEIKQRLRNHSYQQSLNNTPTAKMSGTLPIVEENELSKESSRCLISKDDFSKKNTGAKLDSVAEAINKMYGAMHQMNSKLEEKILPMEHAVFDEEEGILPQMKHLVEHAKSADGRIQDIHEENLQLRDEVDVLKGIIHKLSNKIDHSEKRIQQLSTKSMEDNLIISGIMDDLPKRNPRKQLTEFFALELNLPDVRANDLLSVFRLGKPIEGKH